MYRAKDVPLTNLNQACTTCTQQSRAIFRLAERDVSGCREDPGDDRQCGDIAAPLLSTGCSHGDVDIIIKIVEQTSSWNKYIDSKAKQLDLEDPNKDYLIG